MQLTIGVDIGGTNIKAGVVDASGQIVARRSIETEADQGFEHVFARLTALIADLARDLPRAGLKVGVGVPGPMSHALGMIWSAPNLKGWVNIPLRERLRRATELPISIENDANAAAYGEYIAGAGRGRDMVALTLGTGIGGGVICGGKLWRGWKDTAGEVGHLIMVVEGRKCPCGQRGCLERYSSASAIAERLVEHIQTGSESALAPRIANGEEIDSQIVAQAAREGDRLAQRIWDEACRYLAVACVGLQHLLNPQVLVLAGGLIAAGDQLLLPVREHFRRQSWKIAQDSPDIELATLAGDAGVIGAAALARSSQ